MKLGLAAALFAVSLVVFFGCYLFLKGARNVHWALASTAWPTASATVLRSDTTREVSKGTRRTAAAVNFSTRTVVQYTVNSRTYTTSILHFGQTLGSSDKSEAALQALRYPSGKQVTVSYNPADPSIAAVKPGLHIAAFWLPAAGLAFLLPAVLCLFLVPSIFRNGGQSADRMMPLVAIGFGAVACSLGLLALSAGVLRAWHGNASLHWPTTPGAIVMARKGGGDNGEDAPDDTTDPAYYARFVYEYTVSGVKHFNNLRRFAQVEGGSTEEADRIAERYRKGATVRVSYLPEDPDIAVLEPGNTGAALILPGIGVVLLLFGTATFVFAGRMR